MSNINQRKKYFVKKINNFRCNHCHEEKISEELEVDHIIPIANGGNNDYSNLQPLCIDCHIKKTKGEWEEGFGRNINIEDFTPEEKLEILKDWLDEHKEYSYTEIQFLVLNHKILSKFCYNSATLNMLWRENRGIKRKYDKSKEDLVKNRNILIYIIRKIKKTKGKNKGLKSISYKEMEKIFREFGFEISYAQIRNICAKFGDKDDKIIEGEKKEEKEQENSNENEEVEET